MKVLRAIIWLACCVPILAGLAGSLAGTAFLGVAGPPAADSHFRYLSGLLLGIGIGFAWANLDLQRRAWAFDILAPIVVLGGLFRLIGIVLDGTPPLPHLLALGMELGVTPALWMLTRRAVSLDAKEPDETLRSQMALLGKKAPISASSARARAR